MRFICNLWIWGLVTKNLSIPFPCYIVFKKQESLGRGHFTSVFLPDILTNPMKTFSPNQIYCTHNTFSLVRLFLSLPPLLPCPCWGKFWEAADHEIFFKVLEQFFPYVKFNIFVFNMENRKMSLFPLPRKRSSVRGMNFIPLPQGH